MSIVDFAGAVWRKSSRSTGSGNNGDCVEVARWSGVVGVRDSKNAGGLHLAFAEPAWRAFTARLG